MEDHELLSMKIPELVNHQEFTGTRDAVIAMGYEPCARCHP